MTPVEIEEAVSQLAQDSFNRAEFPFQFLAAFGNKETTLKKLRAGASNTSDVDGGVLQRSNIHIATCPSGEVNATLTALRESPKTASAKAKFILATDGEEFQAEDLTSGETVVCSYVDFHDHFGFFLPLAGITTVKQIRESAFDIKATGRLNRLYLQLLKDNPDWGSAERREDMNKFMARLIFCFFAEDTDIIHPSGLFTKTVELMGTGDASDTHHVISEIFSAMDLKQADREAASLPLYAKKFPYVNGALFSGSTECPRFTKIARSYLLHIGSLDWQKINPDIFGSMIQAIADDEERGALGMHYTSVPNILKVLNPLFLDDLREKLEEASDNGRKLLNLRNRIANIRVFDPACGSGNFLVIAYKEMRAIEAEINRRRGEGDRRSDISITNFRGIELRDFAAEVARLALIIAEYQCDVLYRGQKEALAEFLPLDSKNWITCGNALRLDWLSICPPTGTGVKVRANDLFESPLDQAEIDFENEGGETYICGNPPYKGTRYQTPDQKAELLAALGPDFENASSLDYIAGWIVKAGKLVAAEGYSCAIVSTSSVCEGQQAAILWSQVLAAGNYISFAHRPFRWRNLASHNAAVSVVIVGLSSGPTAEAKLFWEEAGGPVSRAVPSINAYLIAAQNVVIARASKSMSGLPEMVSGEKLTDGGHLVLSVEERDELAEKYPILRSLTGRLVGAQELTKGIQRYALVIGDDDLPSANAISEIAERLESVAAMRRSSSKVATQKLADTPHRFDESRFQRIRKIAVAQLSSENREYYPCDLLDDVAVPMAPSLAIYGADLWSMSLIASRLHAIWIATVCGKLKTDFRYSNTLGWNTFPLPKLTEQMKVDLTRCAENILLAREAHFPATIADLYDPKAMPLDLRRAHDENDETLERIYIGRRFKNDTERLEKLFELYTKIIAKGKAA